MDKNESEEFISEGINGLGSVTFEGSRVVLGSEYNLNRFVNFRGCAQEGEELAASAALHGDGARQQRNIQQVHPPQPTSSQSLQQESLSKTQCVLCYQNECLNGGACNDPSEKFECACTRPGSESPTCATNIDECENNSCVHGECVGRD